MAGTAARSISDRGELIVHCSLSELFRGVPVTGSFQVFMPLTFGREEDIELVQ